MPPQMGTFIEVTSYVNQVTSRIDAAVDDIRDALAEHKDWHASDLARQRDEARQAPGRRVMLATAVLSAIAAAFAGWAAVHPHPVTVRTPVPLSTVAR